MGGPGFGESPLAGAAAGRRKAGRGVAVAAGGPAGD